MYSPDIAGNSSSQKQPEIQRHDTITTTQNYADYEPDLADPLKYWILNGRSDDLHQAQSLITLPKRKQDKFNWPTVPDSSGNNDKILGDPLKYWILNGRSDDLNEAKNLIILPKKPVDLPRDSTHSGPYGHPFSSSSVQAKYSETSPLAPSGRYGFSGLESNSKIRDDTEPGFHNSDRSYDKSSKQFV